TPAPSRSTRPAISWPNVRSFGSAPYSSFISPRQMCRSDPHTPARVSFTRIAPGSGSGTGYSRSSNSPPYAFSTATRPFMALLPGLDSARAWPRPGLVVNPGGRGYHGRALRTARLSAEVVMSLTRIALLVTLLLLPTGATAEIAVQVYALPPGGGPHDVAVGADGIVWSPAQRAGQLGRLDPASGKVDLIPLGPAAAPHGVIIGPDGAPWITEGGTNSIVRVDPATREVKRWSLPESRGYVNLNTATF